MRRLVFALLLLLLPSGFGQAQTSDRRLAGFFQHLQAGQKQTVVVYGTSLTKYGYWATAMQEWFNEQYPGMVTVVNSGGPGQTSDWGVAHVQELVLDHHPDLVFVEFAANDAHTRYKFTVEKSRANLDKIVHAIEAQNAGAAIVPQTMNVFWNNPKGFAEAESARPEIHAFYEGYRAYAKEHGLPLVDNEPTWQKVKEATPETFHAELPDGTHPNKTGSLQVNWPNVKAVLEQGRKAAQSK